MLSSCSISRQISKQATTILLNDPAISSDHIGISIYEPAIDKYWYNYNATKYFVPASNTKLFSLYAGMKYLGDSLIGLRYLKTDNNSIKIFPTGDPTFLHPDYKVQSVFNFLNGQKNIIYCSQHFTARLGQGWAWDDYLDNYMVQRSEFPIYGNLIRIHNTDTGIEIIPRVVPLHKPQDLKTAGVKVDYNIERPWDKNEITLTAKAPKTGTNDYYEVPLYTDRFEVTRFLSDTLKSNVSIDTTQDEKPAESNNRQIKIYSQPSDSLFTSMMKHSDNFFAEQTLLMASNEYLGYMNDEKIIDTLLNRDLKDIPQQPQWVDGSGLSRYNLFTPQSFVYILNKMKVEFGLARLKHILPTGGEGTLSNYYKNDAGFIFAKTGSLGNVCALSGFIITKKNKLLVFSILNNNYRTGGTGVRRAVEKFLEGIREKY